jgi:hypothetical protein
LVTKSKIHVVAKNETLEKIARKYGYTSWREIFDSPLNAKLRKLRKSEKAIQPGDKIIIPALGMPIKARKSLHDLIAHVESRMKRTEKDIISKMKLQEKIIVDLHSMSRQAKRTEDRVDLAVGLLNLIKSFDKLVSSGSEILKKSAKEASKESGKFAKEGVKHVAEQARVGTNFDAKAFSVLEKWALKSDKWYVHLSVAYVDAYQKLHSLSFWARAIVKSAPGEKFDAALMKGDAKAAWKAWSEIATSSIASETAKQAESIRKMNSQMVKTQKMALAEDKKLLVELKKIQRANK